jgi:hypothetical protein
MRPEAVVHGAMILASIRPKAKLMRRLLLSCTVLAIMTMPAAADDRHELEKYPFATAMAFSRIGKDCDGMVELGPDSTVGRAAYERELKNLSTEERQALFQRIGLIIIGSVPKADTCSIANEWVGSAMIKAGQEGF